MREGQAGPGQGQGAEFVGLWIRKEDAFFSPGQALGQERKGLTVEGMKRMGNGEALLPIQVIRCSCQFVQTPKRRAL